MIHYLVTSDRAYILKVYLGTWGLMLRDHIRVHAYEDLGSLSSLSGETGTWIFADLERLSAPQLDVAESLARQVGYSYVLNRPAHYVRRFSLLRRLARDGSNDFRVWCPGEALCNKIRFPVFIREENDHTGSLTRLLHDQRDIDIAVAQLLFRGFRLNSLMVIEFCETASVDGLYRKYAAFRVGDRIIPRHLIFSRNWVLKKPDLVAEELIREETHYLQDNLHEARLREIFEMSGIDYGRIDYSLRDGRIQTWEINTNPLVMAHRRMYSRKQLPNQRLFARRIAAAFAAVDCIPEGAAISREQGTPLQGHMDIVYDTRRRAFRRLVKLCGNYPSAFRPLGRALRLLMKAVPSCSLVPR